MSTAIDKTLSHLLDEVGSLPSIAVRIVDLSADPDCELGDLAEIISYDPAMTLRFLALANSAAVSRGKRIRTLQEALIRLGIRRTRDIALLMGMHDLIPPTQSLAGLDLIEFWKFTMATASSAQCLARGRPEITPDDAWLVGLFHGIGLPLLAQKSPAALARARQHSRAEGLTLVAAEQEVLGFHHGHLAAKLLSRWGLPDELAAAVSQGQGPSQIPTSPLASILSLAHHFVRALGYGDCGDGDTSPLLESLRKLLANSGWELSALIREVGDQVHQMSQLIELDLPRHTLGPALETSRQMAARIGLQGIEDSLVRRDLEDDSRQAREIQRHLFPQAPPQWPGYAVATANLPGRHVSGDTYDFPPAKGEEQALMLADISGKGIAAALLASNLQASVRALSAVIPDLGMLVATINQTLLETTSAENFATMFLGYLEPVTGRLKYISAGHTPALVYRPSGEWSWLPAMAPPLGILPGANYETAEVILAPGDSLVLYTDGISEATNDKLSEFGREGLLNIVAQASALPPDLLVKKIMQAVMAHCSSQSTPSSPPASMGSQDDMTLIVLRHL